MGLIMNTNLNSRIKEIANEFPKFGKWLESIETGENTTYDGVYNSISVDENSCDSFHEYAQITDNKIIALGEERGRDGGWYWFKSHEK